MERQVSMETLRSLADFPAPAHRVCMHAAVNPLVIYSRRCQTVGRDYRGWRSRDGAGDGLLRSRHNL